MDKIKNNKKGTKPGGGVQKCWATFVSSLPHRCLVPFVGAHGVLKSPPTPNCNGCFFYSVENWTR